MPWIALKNVKIHRKRKKKTTKKHQQKLCPFPEFMEDKLFFGPDPSNFAFALAISLQPLDGFAGTHHLNRL